MAIGETLKNAREALGLSHKDVAESTHMLTQMVAEIEDEDYHRFTAPVYGKGFIKLFAKAVGLDPAPLVAEFLANPEGNADHKKKKTVALVEKILTEPKGEVQSDVPEGEPESVDASPPPPPPPPPRHTYARASTVTLPTAHSPYAISTQNPPPPRQPAPPIAKVEPVKPRPPASSEYGEIVKPRSTADDVHNASTFKLEAGSAAVPPQPVTQAREPFKFPSAIKRPTRVETEEAPERPVQAKKVKPPRIRSEDPKRPPFGDAFKHTFKHVVALSGNALKSIREKLDTLIASDDEEESKIRRRYILTGVLVFLTVVIVIVVAASSSGPESGKDKDGPLVAENEIVEPLVEDPVVNNKVAPPVEPLPVVVPTPPVVIARVLPPPKMFAK